MGWVKNEEEQRLAEARQDLNAMVVRHAQERAAAAQRIQDAARAVESAKVAEVKDAAVFEGLDKGSREILIELRNLSCLVAKCHRGGQGHVCGHHVSFSGPPSEEPDEPVVAFLAAEMDRMRNLDGAEGVVWNLTVNVDCSGQHEVAHESSPSVGAPSGAGVGTPTVGAGEGGASDSPTDAPSSTPTSSQNPSDGKGATA